MGFWNGIVKMVEGKPVFEATSNQEESNAQASLGTGASSPKNTYSGPKVIPEIEVEHCKSHVHGPEMDVTVWITNRSQLEIELDKIIMLGRTTELDRILAPNEAREIRLYQGPVAKDDDNEMAHLHYKQRNNGDYFQADFIIEFDYDSQGFYSVEELQPVHPVRDI